jgi:hypothetical protein
MYKQIPVLTVLIIIALLLLWSFKNSSTAQNSPIILSAQDNGKSIVVSLRRIIHINLSFGGGDYFYGAKFDSSVLSMNHYYQLPSDSKNEVIGTLGQDIIEFTPLKKGTSTVQIETPPATISASPEIVFTIFVTVR